MSSINIELQLQMQKIGKIVSYNFYKVLNDNLTDKLILSISNLISLDYIHRLKEQIDITQHSNVCINRIKNYLGYKVIMQEDFSTAMSLFIISITPEKAPNDEAYHAQNQNIIIETIISAHYSDLSIEERENIRTSLKDLLHVMDKDELTNYIHNTPEIFQLTVKSNIKKKQSQLELSNIVQLQIQNTVIKKNLIHEKINKIQNFFTKAVTALSIITTAIISASITPILIPLILIPTSIMGIKYGPTIGKKIARNVPSIKQIMYNFKSNLKQIRTNLDLEVGDELENTIDEKIQQTLALQAKEILNNIEINVTQQNDLSQNKVEEKKQESIGMVLKK